jgi:hypothetical protein
MKMTLNGTGFLIGLLEFDIANNFKRLIDDANMSEWFFLLPVEKFFIPLI